MTSDEEQETADLEVVAPAMRSDNLTEPLMFRLASDNLSERVSQEIASAVNRASELNQFWKSVGMEREKTGEFAEVGFLPRKIE